MNKNIILRVLDENDIPSGNVKAWYNFGAGSGNLVYNDLWPTSQHFVSGDIDGVGIIEKIRSGIYPGLSVGLTDYPASGNSYGGSGKFEGSDLVRIGYSVDLPDWTAFFDFYEDLSQVDQVKGRILLSSVPEGNPDAGFIVGINGLNKLFYEHINAEGGKEIFTLDEELGQRNLVSVSKSNNTYYLSLGYHDLSAQSNSYKVFHLNEGTRSESWHLGGKYDSSSNFTGFSGYFDNFLLLSGTYDAGVVSKIADSHYITDYTEPGIKTGNIRTFYPVTGKEIVSMLSGTGIKEYGYAEQLVSGPHGETINVYEKSGVTGEIYQTGYRFFHSTVGKENYDEFWGAGSYTYDYDHASEYAKNSAAFNNLTSGKRIEVYSSSVYTNDLSVTPFYSYGENRFLLDSEYDQQDLGLKATGFDYGFGVNLYVNGVAQMTGVDYKISGNRILSDSEAYSREYTDTDIVVYDKVSGSHVYSGYTGAVGIPNTGFSVRLDVGSNHDQKDLYYAGHKLIRGLDWEYQGSDTFNIESDSLQYTGYLMWLPRHEGVSQSLSGFRTGTLSCNYSGFGFNLVSEQIWVDGLRSYPSLDKPSGYVKTAPNSLLNSCNVFTNRVGYVYNNETGYFNT